MTGSLPLCFSGEAQLSKFECPLSAYPVSRLSRNSSGWLNWIEYFPLNKVEIDFSTFGPTIGLVGTLRGAPNDQLVKSVSLMLVRDKDRSTHKFEWTIFRSTNIVGDTRDIQVASGLLSTVPRCSFQVR